MELILNNDYCVLKFGLTGDMIREGTVGPRTAAARRMGAGLREGKAARTRTGGSVCELQSVSELDLDM